MEDFDEEGDMEAFGKEGDKEVRLVYKADLMLEKLEPKTVRASFGEVLWRLPFPTSRADIDMRKVMFFKSNFKKRKTVAVIGFDKDGGICYDWNDTCYRTLDDVRDWGGGEWV